MEEVGVEEVAAEVLRQEQQPLQEGMRNSSGQNLQHSPEIDKMSIGSSRIFRDICP